MKFGQQEMVSLENNLEHLDLSDYDCQRVKEKILPIWLNDI